MTFTVPVTGAANYNDYDVTVTVSFVDKDVQTLTTESNVTATYGDTGKKITVTNDRTNGGAISYEVTAGTDVIDVNESGNITIKKAGVATVKVTAAETDDYAPAEKDCHSNN